MDRVTVKAAKAPKPAPVLQVLPPRAPLEMPIQSLSKDAARGARRRLTPSLAWRRVLMVGATVGLTSGAALVMLRLLQPGGLTPADMVMLGLFVLLFAWVAFAMASAAAGFVTLWRARDLEAWRPQPIIFSRTALLLPTYNEDPGRVLAGVQAIYEDLEAKGVSELFDIFVLSDTRLAAVAQAEVTGVMRLRDRLGAGDRIFYRRRALNLGRKAGNVADWVKRFGGAYECMLVLDADSLMSADTIIRLTAAMERDPKAGLIQTSPVIIGATTLFARLQQFTCRIYGPLIAQGQDWWSGDEGNYWGHNAIIRTKAFASCAGLPHLKAPGALGGAIMSHDFVEAALMRRGGWAIRMAPALAGSFEETPPSLLDMAVRDRRWCQGNLQHSAVLPATGLHWVSRLHLARGVLAYLTAPLWLAFLLVGGLVWMQQRGLQAVGDAGLAELLFGATMAMLLAPKLMGAVLIGRNGLSRRACGGGVRLALGAGFEILLSALMAPVFMLMHSRAVVDVLRGRDSGWAAQKRDEDQLSLKQAWRRHWAHTLIGGLWAAAALRLDPVFLVWSAPVAVGLALSIPISMLTSRTDLGGLCRRLGLLLTPEETEPPQVMVRAAALRAQYDREEVTRIQIDRLFRAAVPVHTPAPTAANVLVRT